MSENQTTEPEISETVTDDTPAETQSQTNGENENDDNEEKGSNMSDDEADDEKPMEEEERPDSPLDELSDEWEWPVAKEEENDQESDDDDDKDKEGMELDEEPYIKFRRLARAVTMLIQVCHACKSLLVSSVAQENWFALVDNVSAATALQSGKRERAFVTKVLNEQGKFVDLKFDVNDYRSSLKSEDLFTDEIRDIMKKRPGTRSQDQLAEVVRCMKGLSKPFREYPLNIQKDICQYGFYDKYKHNRVIIRRGLPPDGIYFVISGTLIVKPEGRKNPDEIHAGEKLGEEDLVCGCMRRATVVTKNEVEILFLHRFSVDKGQYDRLPDYMDIFNMAPDSNDSSNLDICKQNIVLRHFPLQKLIDNPGTWSTLKYKYGRLIVKDSNDMEWLYVIMSGEARVISYLEPGVIDVKARRKIVQKKMQDDSFFHRKKKILDFVSDREYMKSKYNPTKYHPGPKRTILSAPPTYGHRKCLDELAYKSFPGTPREFQTTRLYLDTKSDEFGFKLPNIKRPQSETGTGTISTEKEQDDVKVEMKTDDITERKIPTPEIKQPVLEIKIEEIKEEDEEDDEKEETDKNGEKEKSSEKGENESDGEQSENGTKEDSISVVDKENEDDFTSVQTSFTADELKAIAEARRSYYQKTGKSGILKTDNSHNKQEMLPKNLRERKKLVRKKYLNAPDLKKVKIISQKTSDEKTELPPFVQVETLHPGQCFGLRSCLDPADRGPSVSLISGDCEVLSINKKFFLKHADDAMFSLIKLKSKEFPQQEELIDRLDITMQWDEFKHQTMKETLETLKT